MELVVTEYHRPNGRTTQEILEIGDEFLEKVQEITLNGFHFTAEHIRVADKVALTISDDKQDYAVAVVPNDMQLPMRVEAMIQNFTLLDALAQRAVGV